VCANRVVEKFTGLVSKNLGWGGSDLNDSEWASKPATLTSVLQAVDTHLESIGETSAQNVSEQEPGDENSRHHGNDAILRERGARLVNKLAGVAALSSDLSALFEHYDAIGMHFESTRATLRQTAAKLAEESEAHANLENRFAALDRELVLQKSETAALQAQLEQAMAVEAELQQHVQGLEADLQQAHEQIQQLSDGAEASHGRVEALVDELQTARQDVSKAEIEAVALRTELSSALSHASDVEAVNSALQVALSDSRHGAQQLGGSLDEAYLELSRTHARLVELEQERENQVAAHEQVHALLQAEAEDRRAEVATVHIQLAVLTARLEVADRLLSDVPALMERATIWEERVASLETENAEFRTQAAEFEEVQEAVAERAHALVGAFKAKEKEATQSRADLASTTERLESETKRFEDERARLEAVVAELGKQLEAEKSKPFNQPRQESAEIVNGAVALTQSDKGERRDGARAVVSDRTAGETAERPELAKSGSQKALNEEKPNSGGGRKRSPRLRESNRQASRH
jgi:chromosome segregation ATPase